MADRPSDDAALVSAARDGDLEAFEALVRAHTPAVYAHAYRIFGEPKSAEDATQEVWLKVFRTLSTFDGRSRFSTWLFRVTRNVCLDLLRAGKRRPVVYDPLDTVPAPDDLADTVALSASIESAMLALSSEDRDALSAVALFGLSYAEAAETLGVPAGTVKSRVFRARRTLATILGLGKGGA